MYPPICLADESDKNRVSYRWKVTTNLAKPMDAAQNVFRDIEASLKAADFEFKQRRFAEAAPIYARSLESLRQARPAGHADTVYCLQRLSDSYAFSHEFNLALPALIELYDLRQKQPGVNNADLIGTTFKLAKVFEMLGNAAEAQRAYDGALQLAEQSLYKGHPLIYAICSNYADVVRFSHGSKELLATLDKKKAEATEGLGSLADNVLDGLNLREYTEMRMEMLPDPEPPPPELDPNLPPPKPLISKKQLAIGLGAIVAIAVIYLGTNFAIQKAAQQKKIAEQNAMNALYAGKTFESIDGLDKLTFFPDGSVDAVIDGTKLKAKFLGLPPGSNFSTSVMADARAFREVDKGMLSDEGRILLAPSAAEHAVVDRMKLVAAAAQKYFEEHKEYPQTAKDLTDTDPQVSKNPVTNVDDEITITTAGKDRDFNPEDASQEPAVVEQLKTGELLPDEAPLAPGAVHCYLFFSGDSYSGVKCKAFFIRACDADGKFLPGKTPGKVFVGRLLNGRVPEIAGLFTPKDASSSDPKVTTIKVIEADQHKPSK